MYMEKQPELR